MVYQQRCSTSIGLGKLTYLVLGAVPGTVLYLVLVSHHSALQFITSRFLSLHIMTSFQQWGSKCQEWSATSSKLTSTVTAYQHT